MVKKRQKNPDIAELKKINMRLEAENKKLKQLAAQKSATSSHRLPWLRSGGVVFFIALAGAILLIGNILFWAGNTVVKTDRYTETVAPLIRDPVIQGAVAHYATDQLFLNIDVENITESVLPPRAAFLAPALDTQLRGYTEKTIQTILKNPRFQTFWDEANKRSHERLIETAAKHGSDGVININELYQQLSSELKDTKLAFLADKKLPERVGSYKVLESDQLALLSKTANNIDWWRTLAVIIFAASVFLAVWLSRNRRKTVIALSLTVIFGLFITLVSFRIAREATVSGVDAQYTEAVRRVWQIIFHPLQLQTLTLMATAAIALLIAWLSGPYTAASRIRGKLTSVLEGKLHYAVFGESENQVSQWVGAHKRQLQWLAVAGVGVVALIIRLTPKAVVISALILLLLVLLTEVIAAPSGDSSKPHPNKR